MLLPIELAQWAARHGVAADAVAELAGLLGAVASAAARDDASESNVQSRVRLAGPAAGFRLFRNNCGVLTDERGVPVRFGLANDSKKLNEKLKSHDLIGWRRLAVTPDMVGKTVAQFASLECKHANWKPGEHRDREQAQMRWATLVAADGGFSRFVTGPEQIANV